MNLRGLLPLKIYAPSVSDLVVVGGALLRRSQRRMQPTALSGILLLQAFFTISAAEMRLFTLG